MDEEVKERVSTLEAVLGEFIVQTNKSLRRMEEDTRVLKKEMTEFKKEMADFKEEAERDRKEPNEKWFDIAEFKKEMADFKEEAERDRKEANEKWFDIAEFKKEMAEYRKKGEQHRREMNKKWGDLANRLGTLAEDISAPNMRTIATKYFGCKEVDTFSLRVSRRSRKNRKVISEFDVVLSADEYLFINETKLSPVVEHVREFADKLASVFDYLPEFEGKTVVPVFSSMQISPKVVEALTRAQIYAMSMGGDNMELLNYEAVRNTTAARSKKKN